MISIIHAAFRADILLILGVAGCTLLPFVKFFTRKRCFVNIDGIEWKRNKWKSIIKTFLRYSEIQAVEVSEVVVTDNEVIKKYFIVKELGEVQFVKRVILVFIGAEYIF